MRMRKTHQLTHTDKKALCLHSWFLHVAILNAVWTVSSFDLFYFVVLYSKWYIPCVCVCFVFRRMSHSVPDTQCSCRRLHPCQYTQIVNTLAYAQSIRVCINVCVRVLCVAEFPLFISSHLHMAHGCHHRGCGGWGWGWGDDRRKSDGGWGETVLERRFHGKNKEEICRQVEGWRNWWTTHAE